MASPVHLTAATRLLSSAAWLEAETEARAALADDPANPHATLILGLAVAAMGEDARAAPILARAAAARPGANHPCVDLAGLQPSLARALVARQFRACLRCSPPTPACGWVLPNSCSTAARPPKRRRSWRTGRNSAAGHHLMGLAQAEQNRFPAAIASFQHAVALNPDAAASWSNLGMVLKVEDRFAESIAAHDRAVALDPDNPRFRVNRAVALLKAGLWDRAWQDYEARLDLTGAPAVDPIG